MKSDKREKLVRDIALALILLSSWDEDVPGDEPAKHAWKGYDFDILDALKEDGLIDFSYKAKSLYLTKEGVKEAEKIIRGFEHALSNK
jgi:hypothetical protein